MDRMAKVIGSLLVLLLHLHGAKGANHVVGGDLGSWQVSRVEGNPSFYQDWAASQHFVPVDTLEFNFNPGDTIVEVDDLGFATCDGSRSDKIFNTGHLIVTLAAPASYYWISGDPSQCAAGLRMGLKVNYVV